MLDSNNPAIASLIATLQSIQSDIHSVNGYVSDYQASVTEYTSKLARSEGRLKELKEREGVILKAIEALSNSK